MFISAVSKHLGKAQIFLMLFSSAMFMATSSGRPLAPGSVSYPMAADAWKVAPHAGWVVGPPGTISFARYESLPNGAMTLNEGVAESTKAFFSNGTIDFDIKPLDYSDTGIIFRRQGIDSGEFVYLRANPDCPAADDCIQYAPITHGLMQWDIYSDRQGSAPLAPTGWNHLHIVVAGTKMVVYVNRELEPSLIVPRLQGASVEGGIAFKGPAVYANLVVTHGEASALQDLAPDPVDPGAVIHWSTAPPTIMQADGLVYPASIPAARAWRRISAEDNGLVNLSREFGIANAPSTSVAWLKTIVIANAPSRRSIRLGWARQVTVFLNGQPIFSGSNPYYPDTARLSPNGRLQADNAIIQLDLKQGPNEIILAVGNRWQTHDGVMKADPYGWGAQLHFEDLLGITLQEQ